MTRETKIGLVVAGSFLCLVCVVVASKMNGAGDSFEESKQPPTGPTNLVAAVTTPQQGNPKPNGEKLPQIVPAPTAPTRDNVPAPNSASVPPGNAIPSQVKSPEQKQKELEDAIQRQKKEKEKSMAAPSPLVSNPTFDLTPIQIPPATVPDVKMTVPSVEGAQPSNPQRGGNVPVPTPPPNAFGNPDPDLMPPPQVLPPKQVELPPAVPVAPQVGGPNSAKVDPIPSPANPPMPIMKDSFPIPKDVPPPVVPKADPTPFGTAPDPLAPLIAPPPGPPAPNGVSPPGVPAALPPTNVNPFSPVPTLPPSGLPPAGLNPPSPVPSLPPLGANPPAPAQTPLGPPPSLNPPGPIPSISTTPLPSTPPIQVAPPGSATAIPTLPPGGFNSLPPVKTIEPDVVKVAPGEKTFMDMSMRLYRDPKYAAALQAFNRDHWQALSDGQALAVYQPVLNPNQQVLHPPVGILERDYAKLIGSAAPVAVIPTPGPMPAVRATPVVPSAPPVTILPAGARPYTVQAVGGERIRDIAQRMLGNADRWTDIYRLNPTLQPQFAIPQGTQLQLP